MDSLPTTITPAEVAGLAIETRNDFRGCVKGEAAATRYLSSHSARKNRAELKLVRDAVSLLPSGSFVLDVPCGNGRLIPTLTELGMQVTGMDLSPHCLENCEHANPDVTMLQGDLSKIPLDYRTYDGVLCFRFHHHLSEEADRAKLISELCRVSERFVFLSYFDPYSPGSLTRTLKRTFLQPTKAPRNKTTTLSTLKGHFAKHGFYLTKNLARMPVFHSLNIACFERESRSGLNRWRTVC